MFLYICNASAKRVTSRSVYGKRHMTSLRIPLRASSFSPKFASSLNWINPHIVKNWKEQIPFYILFKSSFSATDLLRFFRLTIKEGEWKPSEGGIKMRTKPRLFFWVALSLIKRFSMDCFYFRKLSMKGKFYSLLLGGRIANSNQVCKERETNLLSEILK